MNKYKSILLIIFVGLAATISAQDIFSDMPGVIVRQDSAISSQLSDKINNIQRQKVEVQGYRVQLYSSNKPKTAKTEAFELEKRLQDMQLDYPIYVLYNPPFWKIRVGDFQNQDDATVAREELLQRLPDIVGDIYIVRDKIIVMR